MLSPFYISFLAFTTFISSLVQAYTLEVLDARLIYNRVRSSPMNLAVISIRCRIKEKNLRFEQSFWAANVSPLPMPQYHISSATPNFANPSEEIGFYLNGRFPDLLSDGELAARPSSNSGSEWDTWMNSALTYVYSFHIEETFKLGVVYVADGEHYFGQIQIPADAFFNTDDPEDLASWISERSDLPTRRFSLQKDIRLKFTIS